MESKKIKFFNKLSFTLLLATIFLSLFFFVPLSPISIDISKGFIISILTTLSLFFWLVARLGDGKFLIPKDKLISTAFLIPIIFLISSFFSFSFYTSLFGSGFEIGTFGSMLILFIILFLSSLYFQSEKRIKLFFYIIFLGGLLLLIFELINIIVSNFNLINLSNFLGNFIGDWNDFGTLVGLLVLVSLFTLELLKTNKLFRILQYIILILGLLFLIIINIPFIWILVGLFTIILSVYIISIQRSGIKIIQNEGGRNKFPFLSLIVVFLSLVFFLGNNLIGNFISDYISINNVNVRPSITTTSTIVFQSIKHNPLIGTGPNTFVFDWARWQPKEIAQTVFWNVDFSNGFSFLMTILITTGLLGFLSVLFLLIIYVTRGIQSIKIALQNTLSNYFIITTLMISLYIWVVFILGNPNMFLMVLLYSSMGLLVGILVKNQAIRVKEYSFISDPRNNFFSVLGLLVLMIFAIFLAYVYIEKLTSLIYFSRGLRVEGTTIESLIYKEKMVLRAIALDKNDNYYRALSQIYLGEMNFILKDKNISSDILKSNLQQVINKSEESSNLAINQNKKNYLNYLNLGNVYQALVPLSVENSYEGAILAYNKATILAPNNPSIPLARATLEFINKNNSEARKFIKQALNLKPNYIDAIFLLVQIETNEGNLSEAIKQAEYAGEVAPNDPTVFFRLGLLRFNKENYIGAISAFEKAVTLDNNYLNARFFLGQAYKKAGRVNDAMTQFNILNKIIPDNQEIKDAINSLNNPSVDIRDEDNQIKTEPPLKEKI